jgi:hypothetical protein
VTTRNTQQFRQLSLFEREPEHPRGKYCPSCEQTLPLDAFHRQTRGTLGRAGYCKNCSTEYARGWRRANPGYFAKAQIIIQSRLRLEVLAAYGAACVRCGQDNHRVLTIEHNEGGGKRDLAESKSLWTILRRIKAEGYPDCYTVLCRNCNMEHGANGRDSRRRPGTRNQDMIRRVHAYYGNRCVRCGCAYALDVDHRFGVKNQVYRTVRPRGSASLASWIIKHQAWELFQILCHNCNWLKMLDEDARFQSTPVPEGVWHGLTAARVFEAVAARQITGDIVNPCKSCGRPVLQLPSSKKLYCGKACIDYAYNVGSGKCQYKRKRPPLPADGAIF